ncbi:MAG TPA: hypothetical protein VJ276_07540 [Thermoanaerobaculia bacterium]|nr:hypothetical protein [Thermoanaerobaculia bacterium]
MPAILFCSLATLLRQGRASLAKVELVLAAVGALAILAVLCLAAYGFLDFRAHAKSHQPQAHGEGARHVKRRYLERHHGADDEDEP